MRLGVLIRMVAFVAILLGAGPSLVAAKQFSIVHPSYSLTGTYAVPVPVNLYDYYAFVPYQVSYPSSYTTSYSVGVYDLAHRYYVLPLHRIVHYVRHNGFGFHAEFDD